MSLHTIVRGGIRGLEGRRTRARAGRRAATPADRAARSLQMRGLEAGMALTAIAAAVLIGLGR